MDVELEPDGPIKDYCGTCTNCLDACPTQAITEPYVVDGSKCISYFTIELKDQMPQEAAESSATGFSAAISARTCARGTAFQSRTPRLRLARTRS